MVHPASVKSVESQSIPAQAVGPPKALQSSEVKIEHVKKQATAIEAGSGHQAGQIFLKQQTERVENQANSIQVVPVQRNVQTDPKGSMTNFFKQSDGLATATKQLKKKGICYQYRKIGSCENGAGCRYEHIEKRANGLTQPQSQLHSAKNASIKPQVTFAQAVKVAPVVNQTLPFKHKAVQGLAKAAVQTPPGSPASSTICTISKISVAKQIRSTPPTTPASSSVTKSSKNLSTTKPSSPLSRPAPTEASWDPESLYYGQTTIPVESIDANVITAKLVAYGAEGQSGDSKSFPYLKDLPGEVRNKIWGFAAQCSVYKCVIRWKRSTTDHRNFQPGDGFLPVLPPPALLHVSRESRSYLLGYGHYKLAFGSEYAEPKAYFNFEKDIVFINTKGIDQLRPAIHLMKYEERHQIAHLALPLRDAYMNSDELCRILARLQGLQTCQLLVGDSRADQQYANHTNFRVRLQALMEEYWHKRVDNDPEKLRRGPPKIGFRTIDHRHARFYGIDDLKWYAGEDLNTWYLLRRGYGVREAMGSTFYDGPRTMVLPRR